MYNAEKIKDFYNNYGISEWNRLDASAYNRLNFHLHMHFLKDFIGSGKKVLDAGCGAGRFSIAIAESGSKVTLVDISNGQLEIAKQKLNEHDMMGNIENIINADLCKLNMISDNTFDTVVCYGAALNYLVDEVDAGIKELKRVLKQGGELLVSVNSRWGVIHSLIGRDNFDIVDFFGRPDYWYINEVADTGYLPQHPDVAHPPRYFFDADDLKSRLQAAGLKNIELGGSPCLSAGFASKVELIEKDMTAWNTLLSLEEKTYMKPTLVDYGEFLLARCIK